MMLADEEYELIDAEANPELTKMFGVRQAPTFVVVQDGVAKKYINTSNIQKYLEENEY